MPVNLMPDEDPYAGRMAELDALIAQEPKTLKRSTDCLVCGKRNPQGRQRYCSGRCLREAMRKRSTEYREAK